MLLWILSVLFGCIVSNHTIHVHAQASSVPNWKPDRCVFDDCHQCHARNHQLEHRIQTLEANIRKHVLDASLQERLFATSQSDLADFSDQGGSAVNPSPIRSKRQDNSEIDYSGCVLYPDYVDSSQCTICGGNNASNAWQETCQGKCQQEINSICLSPLKLFFNFDSDLEGCLEQTICVDCSDVPATTRDLEQVPCPPDGYLDNTQLVVLLLDNNHHLNFTNAFNTGTPYATHVGGISLSNTTLDASQFNFTSMTINGNFNMSSAAIHVHQGNGLLNYAFRQATIVGNFDMSSATISGKITSDGLAFHRATIYGNFNMSSATISGGITNAPFYEASIQGTFDMSSATISGGISDYAFQAAHISNNFDMSFVNISDGIGDNAFSAASMDDFDMSSAIISGGISDYAFHAASIGGNFNMSSANISGGISSGAFYVASVGGYFDMSSATISGGIGSFAFRAAKIGENFDMSSATISGGISDNVFRTASFDGNFDMSSANISGGISDHVFQAIALNGNFDMSSATISGGISGNVFQAATINGDFDMSSANISGGITDFGFSGLSIAGNLSFTETIFLDGGIQAGSFAGVNVGGLLNASGARFPNHTLPIQMVFGLRVAQGVDFSHCNLQTLEETQCATGGCVGLADDDDDYDSFLKVQGGPFTGMAMPVGIASTFIDLSHNNLTKISNTSLLGITASTLDLSHNQISVFHPFWFLGAPNAKFIDTTGNPSTCERNRFNSTATEAYTYQETATITCKCSGDTKGTGNFCAKQSCSKTFDSLNVYARAYLGGGYYKSRGDVVLSGETATLQCPAGKHPNSDSAVGARCVGGAFEPQTNQCVNTSWFTPGRIAGIVVGVLIPAVIIAAIIGYVLFLSPEKRKGLRLGNEVELKEQLLHDTNCDLEEATALNTRMRGAWKIEEPDVQIGSVVASGAFGVVHDGKFAGLRVAVKVLKQPLDEDLYPDVARDFTRECETLMAIRHACLLIFYGAGLTSENRPFMVTEFMSKGSLKKVLADQNQELVWPLRLKFAQQIAKAMEYLHNADIIHRDLKSDNCLVNDELDVKVCDFGTSKFLTAGRSSLQSSSFDIETIGTDSLALSATMTKGVGTILWMAPELFVGGTHYKQDVDMYSYGVIMWELLTREIPWSEIEETQYIRFYKTLCSALENNQRPRIPPEMIESHHDFVMLMQRCWATNAQSRPTFKQVIQILS